ncbi:hypothetical protein NLJ89_g11962 [Agrocybe chaxingu]|uniref:Uncharacterized protein n=1 Tax=Agrocybe chaxingu TaxID=84603 RepID=A0A9W8JKX5_9AGAR|nr:hypothetical protein NLJ89_g11962 [Agrocybe chaxingu]
MAAPLDYTDAQAVSAALTAYDRKMRKALAASTFWQEFGDNEEQIKQLYRAMKNPANDEVNAAFTRSLFLHKVVLWTRKTLPAHVIIDGLEKELIAYDAKRKRAAEKARKGEGLPGKMKERAPADTASGEKAPQPHLRMGRAPASADSRHVRLGPPMPTAQPSLQPRHPPNPTRTLDAMDEDDEGAEDAGEAWLPTGMAPKAPRPPTAVPPFAPAAGAAAAQAVAARPTFRALDSDDDVQLPPRTKRKRPKSQPRVATDSEDEVAAAQPTKKKAKLKAEPKGAPKQGRQRREPPVLNSGIRYKVQCNQCIVNCKVQEEEAKVQEFGATTGGHNCGTDPA